VADSEAVRAARSHFERALKIDSNHLEALSGYALTCALLDECMDAAASRVKRAVALSPANGRAVLEAALIQSRRGANDEADGFWSLLTRISPTIDTRRYAMKQTRAYRDRSITIQ
jgi:cytochrome c-type biogenesis protein CcmH/NrfG